MLILVLAVVEGYGVRQLARRLRRELRRGACMQPECNDCRAAQLAQMSNSAQRGSEVLPHGNDWLPNSCPVCIDVVHKKLKLHYFEKRITKAWKIVKVFAKFWL
ncbi:hypothetical protein ACTOWA_08890 [Herbaspirillum seropedicae]|uniref:hypothetical protein n=1 Tax=Herbaspirillum seropedicae TaxID=964 RepID=UPI0028673283|nr:hypothetical protein [Herbaspirillum seropedicae]MDR6396190.1 hypothetical protein [Herbaspirillum seropedicae]